MGSPIDVLIVDDNPADAKIAKLLIQAAGIDHRSTVVEDRQELSLSSIAMRLI